MTFMGVPTMELSRRFTRKGMQASPKSGESVDTNLLLPGRKEGDPLYIGDVYDSWPTAAEKDWFSRQTKPPGPYLSHIKSLQNSFPHLRYLSNWMEVTTAPAKWDLLMDHKDLPNIMKERAHRINAAVVDFSSQDPEGSAALRPTTTKIDTLGKLDDFLDNQGSLLGTSHRLYVVEDLSREVIERLGMKLDIDPLFFREQISDYTWANVRDPWVELPDLDVVSRERPFFHLTYVQPRYFKTKADLMEAQKEAGSFNVLRRLDDDIKQRSIFDKKGDVIAHVRSKFSLWTRPAKDGRGAIAVLLLDPTIKAGFPLWKGYRPFINSPTPSNSAEIDDAAPRLDSLLNNFLYWTVRMSPEDIAQIPQDPRIMAYRMYQIYCAEWLSLSCYIQARLGQIEWEIESEDFRHQNEIGPSLAKLHTWRRRVPLFKNNVTAAEELLYRNDRRCPPFDPKLGPGTCIKDMEKDFGIVSQGIKDVLKRTERIAAVATAVTSIEETQRAVEHNQNLGRLTYLAVVFAPLSFVTSFFSMSPDLENLSTTIWAFFCVAVPMSIVVYLLVEKEWKENLPKWWAAPFVDKFDTKKWKLSGGKAVAEARKEKEAREAENEETRA